MALFGFGKKKDEEKKAETAAPEAPVAKKKPVASKKKEKKAAGIAVANRASKTNVLVRPRITEKATFAAEHGAYVFDVAPNATKVEVREAVRQHYKVTPRKVNIVTVPSKKIQSRFRGRFGVTAGGKKAYVYLKDGDTIEAV